jgi:Tfp pilus assembly protein FimT
MITRRRADDLSRTGSSGRRDDVGFTLLEVALAVLIIALVLGISYPAISRGGAMFRLRSTGRDLVNTIRIAREKAVTEQVVMMVTVDRENQKIVLTDELGEAPRVYSLPREIRVERMTYAGKELVEGPLAIRFLPNGSAEDAVIEIVSEKGSRLRVVTDAITGGARLMQPSEGEAP